MDMTTQHFPGKVRRPFVTKHGREIGCQVLTMDDYRKSLIEYVKANPCLWDPACPDYKIKDSRKLAWDTINVQLPAPMGSNINAKAVWDHLTRGFSNALRRKDKRSGSGSGSDIEWRFEKNMRFLLPVKQARNSSGFFPEVVMDTTMSDEESIDSFTVEPDFQTDSQPDTEIDVSREEDNLEPVTIQQETETVNYMQQPQKKRKSQDEIEDETSTIIKLMRQRQAEKSKESPRLSFFRSIMPVVDSLDDDQFMELQIEIIQSVQKVKQARHPVTYQQPAQYASNSSVSPAESSSPGNSSFGTWNSNSNKVIQTISARPLLHNQVLLDEHCLMLCHR